jgi:hypothetical protein
VGQSKYIYQKLELFIKKFYTNELIKGSIFFIGLGLFYFLFTLFVEYFLWLKPMGRTFLFWLFIVVEFLLLFRFILFPVFQLFKLKKGIDYNEASVIIGKHFSDINDKLTNFLQLSNDPNQSELLLASIEQKANSLQLIPFGNAINLKTNKKYLPLAIAPLLLFLIFYISGNNTIISQSFNRVVHFKEQFLPPAPFEFEILNPNLQTEQNKDFILRVKTKGKFIPEKAFIVIDNERYYMESTQAGEFLYKFDKLGSNFDFHIEANEVSSMNYSIIVNAVPTISNFLMRLDFPAYLNKKPLTINGTGNAVIPEGTKISWLISTFSTKNITWSNIVSRFLFIKNDNMFSFTKVIIQNTDYQIFSSNKMFNNYEKLNYQLSVIKDQFPTINVDYAPDSLKLAKSYVLGKISDDYGLSKLHVVYFPKKNPSLLKRGIIPIKKDSYDQFVFNFPSTLLVEQGVSYEYYFEVFDNDALHNFKRTKSSVFSTRINTDLELIDIDLQDQNNTINSLEKSLRNQDMQLSELDKLENKVKEKENLEFSDKQKLSDFIKHQNQQDKLMKEFASKMKENIDKSKTDKKDDFKEDLQKRLDHIDKDLEKNKKLLEELKQLNDKINQEDLMEKLSNFKQNAKNQTKSLEQLVELTKKYYVEKKAKQLKDKLDNLSKKQDDLSNKDMDNNSENQEEINNDFDKIKNELKDLAKENKEFKKPLDIPNDKDAQKSITDDLNKASEELQKNSKSKAKPKQKSASKQMKQLAQKMEQSMDQGEMEQLEEDITMLRQILDNLLSFSFSQEAVMSKFKKIKTGSPSFNANLKTQQNLKLQFKHIDDSLFSLSLRNPKIGENITKEIGNAVYNLDKSLESLVDNLFSKGILHQQYTVSSSNKLANILADVLSNLNMSMSSMSSGKPKPGEGEGMQLSDIIKKQEGISNKMKDGLNNGSKPGEGKDGKDGDPSKKEGNSGKNGSDEKDGEGDARAIMEIYKEQKELRDALQNELEKQGVGGVGQNALEQMKSLEKQLLNKGFKNETLQKSLHLKQELLKLNTALQQQGQENKRQSEANKKDFNNQAIALPRTLTEYLNSIEILNRQSLPLRSNFNQKVQIYFKKND